MPPTQRTAALLLLAAFVVAGLAWATLRISIESRLALAAERDLYTILDLVASELRTRAAASPDGRGMALAQSLGSARAFIETLQRVRREQLRHIYFFDASGRVLTITDRGGEMTPPGDIVRRALSQSGERVEGLIDEPYEDVGGTKVIGAWRWLPPLAVGIVVERPYVAFSSPLRWLDAVFLAMLALIVLGALLINLPSLHDLTAALRRSDLQRCGPYLIERRIGEGAMANVYLARHRHLGRVVALKLLKGGATTDELSARFDREAKLASRLSHPNIVAIFDHGRAPEGGFYYAMEFIRGLTIPQWVQEHGPVTPARTVRVLRQICSALAAMHGAGLLHRDVKPDNVMVYAAHDDYDLVKLIDFGLVKNVAATETRDLTRNLRVLGTPSYMAPERLLDPRHVDRRADLYGIGCIGFYLLAGRRPFEAVREADVAQQVLHVEAPRVASLSPFTLPPRLDALIAALLAKDKEARPASAEAVAAELEEIARLVPWRAELARLWWRSAYPAFHHNTSATMDAPAALRDGAADES